MREREVERRLVLRVGKAGGLAVKLAPTVSGVPDRLVLLPDLAPLLVELKSPTGRLRPDQVLWHSRAQQIGHPVYLLRTREQVDAWVDLCVAGQSLTDYQT